MTLNDAFFEQLTAINDDQTRAAARLEEVGGKDGEVLIVNPDDTETMEAIALFQDAQRRLAALLATVVPD